MIKNYFTVGYRNFRKGHIYSVINLASLAVGLSGVMLIIAYINYELSFDEHFTKSDRIYQLVMESKAQQPIERSVLTPQELGNTLVAELPEVESSTTLLPYQATYLLENQPVQLNAIGVSPNFLEIFDLAVIQGNKAAALKDESGVVLTRATAEKLFPGQDAVGKMLSRKSLRGKVTHYMVTAVCENIPKNTHFNADILSPQAVNIKTLDFRAYSGAPQFVLVKPNANHKRLEAKIQAVLKKYNLGKTTSIRLLPLTNIHLRAGKISGATMNLSDIRYIYMLGSAALLILLIGCVNYVNLTTAQALQRIKEVGIRKTLGGGRRQLAFQFIGESFLIFLMAAAVAMGISVLVLPMFNQMLRVDLPATDLLDFSNMLMLFMIALGAGLLSGTYPALMLSRMQPAGILKGGHGGVRINFSVRKLLIVFQFSMSIMLVIATIVVWQQLHLFHNRPLGFEKQHLLTLSPIHLASKPQAFKDMLLSNPNITSVSLADLDLGNPIGSSSSMSDPADSTQRLHFGFVYGDMDFLQTMGIRLAGGRNFSPQFASDNMDYDSLSAAARERADFARADEILYQNPIIITQSLAKTLHLKKPVNAVIRLGALQGTVIGVVQDFQVTTLKETSPLLVYKPKQSWYDMTTYIRVANRNIPQSIEHIEKTWKAFFPEQPFQYAFADDRLQKSYDSENRLASVFSVFAVLAIVISSLGLFSLAALVVRQRLKEIGIRKVLGASVPEIVLLLSREFVLLILVAAFIASPVAWYAMNLWLQDFANRVDIPLAVFLAATMLALFTGALTVGLQTIGAARSNPVKTLGNE